MKIVEKIFTVIGIAVTTYLIADKLIDEVGKKKCCCDQGHWIELTREDDFEEDKQ